MLKKICTIFCALIIAFGMANGTISYSAANPYMVMACASIGGKSINDLWNTVDSSYVDSPVFRDSSDVLDISSSSGQQDKPSINAGDGTIASGIDDLAEEYEQTLTKTMGTAYVVMAIYTVLGIILGLLLIGLLIATIRFLWCRANSQDKTSIHQ